MTCMIGCVSAGRNFQSSLVREIRLNSTTEQDIRNWFGKPASKMVENASGTETTIYYYGYVKSMLGGDIYSRKLWVEMKDEKVNGYLLSSSLSEDATDFNIDAKNQLVNGQTKMADVAKLLGEPGGVLQLPTGIFWAKKPATLRRKALPKYGFIGTTSQKKIPPCRNSFFCISTIQSFCRKRYIMSLSRRDE